ncbi:hypothetical protein F5Y07DRAFT_399392 [Xylaria sp. FL0933]|nr:hypothetical protein F5Y07DRAFT_399392 [Xylaria sp. FL0933]
MTILEIGQVAFKQDAALYKEVKEGVLPGLITNLQKSGVRNGLFGPIKKENGRDVSKECRMALFLEWPAKEYFDKFITSPGYKDFGGKVKPYAAGPPNLKLFEVDDTSVSTLFGRDTVIEYLAIKPKDASEESCKNILQQVQSRLPQPGTAQVVAGSSVNLETREIALVNLYASDAELDAANASEARKQLLADIAGAADVSSLVAEVKKEIPIAEK